MKDERIKPADGLECTMTCPSWSNNLCMRCGETAQFTVELPSPLGTVQKCVPVQDAIRDAYHASLKKLPRQEYAIANGSSTAALMLDVQEMMRMGWNPSGGVCRGEMGFYQAMVRNAPANQTVDVGAPTGKE